MFAGTICSHPQCRSVACTPFDKCFHHSSAQERELILSHLRSCLEAGGIIKDLSIVGGDFEGLDIRSSHVRASNFSMARLLDTKMEDCNLKRVNFRASAIERVSFLWSNPEEAFFRKEDEES